MSADNVDFELKLRRLKFIEACAYYVRLSGGLDDLNRLAMTNDLAQLITERFKMCKLDWAIAGFKSYEQLLNDGMQEILPDFKGESLEASMVLQYNFRSLVAAEVRNKKMLCDTPKNKYDGRPKLSPLDTAKEIPMLQTIIASGTATTDTTAVDKTDAALTTTTPTNPTATSPIATPQNFLKGFSVFIKPDVHLDETVPICARDQHLLYNIFGDKWTAPVVISAYTTIKGQTGFMHNWINSENHHT